VAVAQEGAIFEWDGRAHGNSREYHLLDKLHAELAENPAAQPMKVQFLAGVLKPR
jgi:hypothetical protein